MKIIILSFFALVTFSSLGQSMTQGQADSIKLEKVNAEINAYREKIEYVKSNAQEDSLAIANGWYEAMNASLGDLFFHKSQIIQSLHGKKWMSKEKFETLPPEKKEIFLNDENYIIEQN